MYTNMKNLTDNDKNDTAVEGYVDRHIPLVECSMLTDFEWSTGGVKHYCP